MVIVGPLSTQEQRTLKLLQRRAVGRVAQRAHMVLLRARGYSVPEIAGIYEVGEETHLAAALPAGGARRLG